MKEKGIVFVLLLVCGLVFSQSISLDTFHVKKSGSTSTQQDTVGGVTTLNARITGNASVLNGNRADSLWYLTGTGKDTSRVNYLRAGSLQFRLTLDDTSTANDSAGTRLKLFAAPMSHFTTAVLPAFAAFVLIDSVDFKPGTTSTGVYQDNDIASSGVDGQGTYAYIYTSAGSNRPAWHFWYVTLEGISGVNKVLSAVENKLEATYAK